MWQPCELLYTCYLLTPQPQPVRDWLRTLGLWAPCRPVWSRDGDPGLRFVDVAAAALAAERNVNKHYQLIGRVRSRRHRHPVIMSVHLHEQGRI